MGSRPPAKASVWMGSSSPSLSFAIFANTATNEDWRPRSSLWRIRRSCPHPSFHEVLAGLSLPAYKLPASLPLSCLSRLLYLPWLHDYAAVAHTLLVIRSRVSCLFFLRLFPPSLQERWKLSSRLRVPLLGICSSPLRASKNGCIAFLVSTYPPRPHSRPNK